jgi:hypothetical protein
LRFRLLRAELEEALAAGKCGGVKTLLQRLDEQESQVRYLNGVLDQRCNSDSVLPGGLLARACNEERTKLQREMETYKVQRVAIEKMCPIS